MSSRHRVVWALGLQWIVAHATAGAAGAAVYAAAGSNPRALPVFWVGVAILGIAQWLVVRRWLPGVRAWPWVTLGGAAVGSVISWPITLVWTVMLLLTLGRIGATSEGPGLFGLLGGAASLVIGPVLGGGIGVGFGQWMLLRYHTRWAAFWVPAGVVSFTIATPSILPLIFSHLPSETSGAAAVGAFGGSVAGTVTGILLTVLVKEIRSQPDAVQMPSVLQADVVPDTMSGHPITITTAPPAGTGPRFAAMVIDSLLILVLSFLISELLLKFESWGSIGTVLLMPFLYHWVFTSLRGQTIGKALVGIKVVDAGGGAPGWRRAALREILGKSLFSYLLWFIAFGPLMMGLLAGFGSIRLDKHRQGWHDKLASTFVVRARV